MSISPLPWSCEQEKNGAARYWLRSGEQYIGSIGNGTNGEESQKRAKDNCDIIMKAVNAHDKLIEALEGLIYQARDMRGVIDEFSAMPVDSLSAKFPTTSARMQKRIVEAQAIINEA